MYKWIATLSVCMLSWAPVMAQANPPAETLSRQELIQHLNAHRIANDNAQTRLEEMQRELTLTRRELRKCSTLLEALHLDPNISPAETVGGLIAAAQNPDASPSLECLDPAMLPGDQINRLALSNYLLREQIARQDQDIQRLAQQVSTARIARRQAAQRESRHAPADPQACEHEPPQWEYTWHKHRVYVGETVTRDDSAPERTPAYDVQQIHLHGTFLNRSQSAYCYTFKVEVYGRDACGRRVTLGYEWVQTPPLAPGALYRWQAELEVDDVDAIDDADCVDVETQLHDHD